MKITMQEYFDKTIEHLASMPHRATKKGLLGVYRCSYLTPEGLKCAIGCHIPDGHEAQSINGGVQMLAEDCPDLAGVAWPDTDNGIDLASKLQGAHDNDLNWDDDGFCGWEDLFSLAAHYGLDGHVVESMEKKNEEEQV